MATTVTSHAPSAPHAYEVPARVQWLNRAPLYHAASSVAAALPRRARLALAGSIGGVLARACPGEAGVMRATLTRFSPALPARARSRQVRELFANFAMCFADLVTSNQTPTSMTDLVERTDGEGQGDRAMGQRGDVAVDFFGAPSRFPLGPFLLARAAGVPMLPAFCVLGSDRRYVVTVLPPIAVERGEEEAGLRRWVNGLAGMLRRYPTQWFNFYDPWSVAHAR